MFEQDKASDRCATDAVPISGPALRSQAEAVACIAPSAPNLNALSIETSEQTLHELRVHQIELEMQNEELRRMRVEATAARARYFDLYDLAPVGYCSLSEAGLILQTNLTASTMLGVDRGTLVMQPLSHFIFHDDMDSYYKMRKTLLKGGIAQTAELRMLKKDGTQFWAHLVANMAVDGAPVLRLVLSDISERKRAEEEIKRHVLQLNTAFMGTVEVATALCEMRDPYTAGHERRVGKLASAIGAELGFDEQRIEGLRVAGCLHDIGKITIPSEILSKPGKLSLIEFQLIQGHAQAGYEALKNVSFPWPLAAVTLQHHERMDGSGYPQGIKGESILLEARIMSVADVVEAMSSHRPYRAALGIEAALAEIESGSDSKYDASVVRACLRLFRENGYVLAA